MQELTGSQRTSLERALSIIEREVHRSKRPRLENDEPSDNAHAVQQGKEVSGGCRSGCGIVGGGGIEEGSYIVEVISWASGRDPLPNRACWTAWALSLGSSFSSMPPPPTIPQPDLHPPETSFQIISPHSLGSNISQQTEGGNDHDNDLSNPVRLLAEGNGKTGSAMIVGWTDGPPSSAASAKSRTGLDRSLS
jgi:hypothetical protein